MIGDGDWALETDSRLLTRGDHVSRLTPKAAHVLRLLWDAEGRALSREALLEHVWPDVVVGEEVLTQSVAEIRRALGEPARGAERLQTVHKHGYLLRRARSAADARPTELRSSGAIDAYAAYCDACERFNDGGAENVQNSVAMFAEIEASGDELKAMCLAGEARSLGFLYLYYGGGDAALRTMRARAEAAVALKPRQPLAQSALGFALSVHGCEDEAFAAFETALELDPALWETNYLLGRACFVAGRGRTAALMLERAAAVRPEDHHTLLVAAKARKSAGDDERARLNLSRALMRIEAQAAHLPQGPRLAADRLVCAIGLGAGEPKELESAADDMLRGGEPYGYYLAGALAAVGAGEIALRALDAMVENGWSHGAWMRRDPNLKDLRETAGYKRLESALF
ncbi:MAG: winged helix-turn-helix domain-containing protein [Pseudomonadota bacterium]